MSKFIGFISVGILLNFFMSQQVCAEEVNLEIFCQQYPFNSRCQRSNQTQQQINIPENKVDMIKFRLEASGIKNEWIRIEVSNSAVGKKFFKAYHTTRVKRNLLSGVIPFHKIIDTNTDYVETRYIASLQYFYVSPLT